MSSEPPAEQADPPAEEYEEPAVDYRFTLANERTLLAWLRTSLALIAGGIGVETFATTLQPEWLPGAIGALAIAVGAILAVSGYFQWGRTQEAMRRGAALPAQHAAPIVTVGIVIVAVGLIIGIVI